MRAGRLRHRLAIQTATDNLDEYGGATQSWATDTTVWGSVEPLRGDERMQAQQLAPEVTHRMRIRVGPTVTPANRITYDSRTFEIVSAIEVAEMSRTIEIMVKELV